MNAEELLTYPAKPVSSAGVPCVVGSDASVPVVLECMLTHGVERVRVAGREDADIDAWQVLQGVGGMLVYEAESSEIEVVCPAHAYSASALSYAAEDADASVISLLAYPDGESGMLSVYMRINRRDPSHAVRSLERHGFEVVRACGAQDADVALSRERLEELQHYLNI